MEIDNNPPQDEVKAVKRAKDIHTDCHGSFITFITERRLHPTNDEWLAWQKAYGMGVIEGREIGRSDNIAATMPAAVDEVLQERSEKLWKEYKPSLEAQKVRSELAHRFDIDDNVPDYVWNLVDIAAQAAMRPAVVDEEKIKQLMCDAYHNFDGYWANTIHMPLSGRPLKEKWDLVIKAIRPYLRTPPDKASTIEKMARALYLRENKTDYWFKNEGVKSSYISMARVAYEAKHE